MHHFIYLLIFIVSLILTPEVGGMVEHINSGNEPVFSISYIDEITFDRINGHSWKPGCPVAIEDLRLLRLSYIDFEKNVINVNKTIVYYNEHRPEIKNSNKTKWR